VLQHHSLELLIRLGKGRRTDVLHVAHVSEHTAMDNRRQIHFVSQPVAMFLISQEIDGQSQPTPGPYGHETLLSERAAVR
jgi:hypothetical protein